MSIFTENIKLYNPFGNRQVLFNYILFSFLIILIYILLLPVKLNGETVTLKDWSIIAYFVFLFSMLTLGSISSKIHLDFITKPFSCCIPNHYKIIGNIILLIGFAGSIIFSILYIDMTYYSNVTRVYYINIAFSGLFVYSCTVLFFLFIKNEHKKYIIFTSVILLYILLDAIIDRDIKFTFSDYVSFSTIPFIIISLYMMITIYNSFRMPGFKRRYFSGNNPISFEPIDPKSAPQINESLRINELPEKKFKPGLFEKIFLKTIKNTIYLGNARTIIAKEYCTLDKLFTLTGWYSWITILTSIFLITSVLLLSGYSPFPENQEGMHFLPKYVLLPAGLFFLCYNVVSGFTPIYHNLLLPVGRSKQLRINLLLFITQMAIAMLWLLLVIAISWMIKENLKSSTFDNSGFTYNPLELSFIFYALVIIPVMDMFLYSHENPCGFITMIILLAVLMALSLYSIFEINPFHKITAMALAIMISNGFFIGQLARYWFKKDIELLN